MKVEIYSDIACPWCYIGERRFKRALAAYPGAGEVEVVFRSYQLDPNTPDEPEPTKSYLERRFGGAPDAMLAQVTEHARGEGIEMDWDRALSVNTFTAHRLLLLAEREYGAAVQAALAEKLFDAHFTQGGNVADHDLLTGLAVEVGMDESRVREYLTSDEGEDDTRVALEQARRIGVQAVPTFVFEGKYAVQGAQSASTFLQTLEQIASELAKERTNQNGAAANDSAAHGADAACEDGSCAV